MGKLKGICLGLQTFGGGSLVAKLCSFGKGITWTLVVAHRLSGCDSGGLAASRLVGP